MAKHKVLVTGPSWIGDMVMAQSLFIWMKKTNPDVLIDVLAPLWTLPVVGRMPEINKAIEFNARHGKLDLAMRIKTGQRLKAGFYDEAIVIPRTLKATLPSLIAGIKKRTGFRSNLGLINNVRSFTKSRQELFVRRYLALVSDDAYLLDRPEIPQPRLIVDKDSAERLLEKFNLSDKGFVVIAPGAEFGPAKQWPVTHFAKLAGLLDRKGFQVAIMGSSKEQYLSEQILEKSRSGNIIDLCGQTSLLDVIDLMAVSHSVVANDSGLMHLAYASGAQVNAIYGSSSALYTPPLSSKGCIIQNLQPCQPCFKRTCQFEHYDCLQSIKPKSIMKNKYNAQ